MTPEGRIQKKAFEVFPGTTQAATNLRVGYIRALKDISEAIGKKYRELSKPDEELTPEGRGYLIALGDILRFEL